MPERIDEIVDVPGKVADVTDTQAVQIKERTIERDFQFIDQSDLVIVVYETEKTSPGVLSEALYAHGHDKPVYMAFPHAKSPFLERCATKMFGTVEELTDYLKGVPVSRKSGQPRQSDPPAC